VAAPIDVLATNGSTPPSIQLTWDAVSGATSYQVWRNTTASTASATDIAPSLSNNSFNDTVTVGTTYYYWIVAVSGSTSSAFSTIATATGGTLVFDDTFGSDGLTSAWGSYLSQDPNNSQVNFTNTTAAEATSSNPTTLQIVSDPSATDGQALAMSLTPSPNNNGTYDSAAITSEFDPAGLGDNMEYGEIQARIKLPGGSNSSAIWPAFWMMGDDFPTVGWPDDGEIDVMEAKGSSPGTNYSTIHGPLPLSVDPEQNGYSVGGSYTLPGGADFYSSYHVFSMNWGPNSITFSIDGTPYETLTPANIPADGAWVFNGQPFFLMLDVSEGSAFAPGTITSTQTMDVDYVRAYSLPAPTSVTATMAKSATPANVTWSATTGATSYQVWRNTTDDNADATLLASNQTTTSYTDNSATVGTNYYYWIVATNANQTSGFSDVANTLATPTITIPSPPSTITYDGTTDVDNWIIPTVTGVSGLAAPTGSPTLTFYAGTAATGTPLSSSPISVGTYTVVANYAGDSNYNPAQSNSVTFTISPAAPSQIVFAIQPTSTTAGTTLAPVLVSIEDKFGNLETSDDSNVTLSVATSPLDGAFTTASTSSTSAIGGVAIFRNLTLDIAGAYTLTANDAGDDLTSAQSNSFTITPAAASKLIFTTKPTGAVAGATVSPTALTIEDAFGNIETSDSSNVVISIDTGPGTLTSSSKTTVAAINGVATFTNLSLSTAGNYTLTAADSSDGLTSSPSSSFTITPASSEKLVFTTPPTGTSAGATLSPIIATIQDSFGNVETTDNSSVSIAIAASPSGAVFAGSSKITVTAVNGIATFSNLILDTAGNYTLIASDPTDSVSTAASSSFTITPAASAKLIFSTQPTGATAGTTLPTFTVSVQDAYGNAQTNDDSTINLTIASGATGGAFTAASTTSVSAINGIATFKNIALNTAGNYTLTASDGNLASATSAGFTIASTILPAAKVAFVQQPTATLTGTAISPAITVDVQDADNNLVATDDSIVTLAIASGPTGATLSGTLTAQAVNGVATFGNVSLNVAGTFNLIATDASLATSTSTSFVVSAPVVAGSQPPIIQTITSSAVVLTGRWWYGTFQTGYYGTEFINDGNQLKGTKSVQFNVPLSTAGNYDVQIWNPASTQNATNVPVEILTSSGTITVTVNEQQNGGEWLDLGSYQFGTTGSVVVETTGTTGLVVANAVKFTQNSAVSLTPPSPTDFTAGMASTTSIPLSWTQPASSITGFLLQQSTDGNTWTTIAYPLATDTSFTATGLTAGTSYYFRIEAISFNGSSAFANLGPILTPSPVSIVQQITSSAVTLTGRWWYGTFEPGYYGTEFINDGNQLKGTKSVQFNVPLPAAGTYTVSIWDPANSQNAASVPVEIITSSGVETVTINEQTSTGWLDLGSYLFGTVGSVIVETTGTTGLVVANAVMFTPAS
jgi:beta-glucanase (GH16 family)